MTNRFSEEVLQTALEKGISEGLFQRPSQAFDLANVLSSLDTVLCAATEKHREVEDCQKEERLQSVKVTSASEIPFEAKDLLFIDMADRPEKVEAMRTLRSRAAPKAFCFIGATPTWARELTMTGHAVYELPAGSVLDNGKFLLKPHKSTIGERWITVEVGGMAVELN